MKTRHIHAAAEQPMIHRIPPVRVDPTRSSGMRLPGLGDQQGSTLLLSLLILAALAIIGGTVALVSMGDRNLSRNSRESLQALAAAETGVAFAKRAIVEETAPMQDYDSDDRPDFVLQDSLDWGGTYRVIAEASDVLAEGVAAYFSNGFCILAEGRFHGAVRRVRVEIVHDSFLKFARYVSQQGLQFECGDVMAGEVYCGNNISLTCGCPAGQEPLFLEKVYAVGHVSQENCGIFERGYEEEVDEIDFLGSIDWTEIRNKARGLSSNNSCEGMGNIGIYCALPGIDPLDLGAQSGPDRDTVVFERFDFYNETLVPGDTVITYGGDAVVNTVTGHPMRRVDFNGIILFEGDARVRGKLDGVSASFVSVFGTDHVLVTKDVICGHTGFDPITRLPTHSGRPVTAALVAEDYVAMWDSCPKVLQVDAAIFSRTSNWRCNGGMGGRPDGVGPRDLDLDGISGETPHNNDPTPGEGWDELNIGEHHWVLNLTGPLVTYAAGDPNPWDAEPVLSHAGGRTYRYNYDLRYMESTPPCFPVPLNLWIDVSWTEVFDSLSPLASNLPH